VVTKVSVPAINSVKSPLLVPWVIRAPQSASFRLPLLILPLGGALEALQRIVYAGSDLFRAKCFEKTTPPAWWEDEVSAILDAAGGRIDGIASNVRLLLQSEWENNMQVELVSFGIHRFDLEGEVQGAA
jgi:hypothetical protein